MSGTIPFRIRQARAPDEEPVTRLLEDEGLDSRFVADEFLLAEVHPRELDEVRLPVTGDQGCCLAGCARSKPLPGAGFELASVAVQPQCRREGIGRSLVHRALEQAHGPVQALCLEPGFFERLGFEPLDDPHPRLDAKARTVCADRDEEPMVWRPKG